MFVMGLFQGLLTAPSPQTCALLACGWALATGRHTITTSLWWTGAATVKHCSRFYGCLGGPFYQARGRIWGGIIRHAAQLLPPDAPMVIAFDDTTKTKSGVHIEGVDRYRHGAGSARQEYRTLQGVNCVLGVLRVLLQRWPGHAVTIPSGLERYLKEDQARQLHLPYRARSVLARSILEGVIAQLPGRQIRAMVDGGEATHDFLRDLPVSVEVGSRVLISGKLYALPTMPAGPRRGRPPRKGPLLGSPTTWVRQGAGGLPPPTDAGAMVQRGVGLWHTVLPGRLVQVVVIRCPPSPRLKTPGRRKPPPSVAAFYTTELSRSVEDVLQQYRDRWAIEIESLDANAFDGLGHDQCRKLQRLVGANTLRLGMAAARMLWFFDHAR